MKKLQNKKVKNVIDIYEEIRKARILKDDKRLTSLSILLALHRIEDRLDDIAKLFKRK